MSEVVAHAALGEYLTSEYELLITVLENLKAKDLWRASQVCKRWNAAAVSVHRKRSITLNTFLWLCTKQNPHVIQPLRKFMEQMSVGPSISFLFINKAMINSVQRKEGNVVAVNGTVCGTFSRKRKNHGFCSKKAGESSRGSLDCWQLKKTDYYTELFLEIKYELPITSELFCIEAPGIIGTGSRTSGNQFPMSREIQEVVSAASMLVGFPENVEICSVSLNTLLDTLPRENSRSHLQSLFVDKNVRAFLPIFQHDVKHIHKKLAVISRCMERKTAVAGGLVNYVQKVVKSTETHCSSIGIAFCGENLKAASLVIPPIVRTKEQMLPLLKNLSDSGIVGPDDVSWAFMFTCVARFELRGENVESSTFKECFPRTPLVGFFGDGEIGTNYSEGNPSSEFQTIQLLAYTTVFVVLSVPK